MKGKVANLRAEGCDGGACRVRTHAMTQSPHSGRCGSSSAHHSTFKRVEVNQLSSLHQMTKLRLPLVSVMINKSSTYLTIPTRATFF